MIKMIDQFLSTYAEWHALVIGFSAMLLLSVLTSWAYLRNEKDSMWEELLIAVILFLIFVQFILKVPTDIMKKNFYSEPWYAMLGGIIGLFAGILITKWIITRLRMR